MGQSAAGRHSVQLSAGVVKRPPVSSAPDEFTYVATVCARCDCDTFESRRSPTVGATKTSTDPNAAARRQPGDSAHRDRPARPTQAGGIRGEEKAELADQAAAGVAVSSPAAGEKSASRESNTPPQDQLASEKTKHFNAPPGRPHDHLTWNQLVLKYGRMSPRVNGALGAKGGGPRPAGDPLDRRREQAAAGGPEVGRGARARGSCLWHLLCALAQTLFPILTAFKGYSLPADLLTDLAAGFTIAILHIPQGMAYGLLSGVEPVYGLYVSFVPVFVMSLMSRSRHVSYGTFAIISMLLVNITVQVRENFRNEQAATNGSALVITDNHQPPDATQHNGHLLRQLFQQSVADQPQSDDSAGLADAADLGSLVGPSNIEILTCVCIVCGLLHITMSLLRLGVLSLMFSDQLVSSFTAAGAVHVLTSQIPGLFDMSLAPISEELFKAARVWTQFVKALLEGEFNRTTALISLASIAFLLVTKEVVEPSLRRRFKRLTCLPSELALMATVILCSSYYKLPADFGVRIVGAVPSGLPEAKVPNLELVPYVLKDSVSVALITFVMNLSIARVYAKKYHYELDPNQELFALGGANLVGSFFSCFPCASSLSRSSVQSNLNVKSQLCSLFSCCFVLAIVCYCAGIVHDLPKSTLSCIIVVALKGILMQIRDVYDNWRLSKLDAAVWVVTFVAVIVFGVTLGLVVGIAASLAMIFLRLLSPSHSVLARLPGTEIFVDKDAFAQCEELEHVKIFRFNSALCYLNRTSLKTKIAKLLPGIYEPSGFRAICSQFHGAPQWAAGPAGRVKFLVVDCSALSYCDYSGLSALVELVDDLADKKICVFLAACPTKLVDMIEKLPRGPQILAHNVYPTIGGAIAQVNYLKSPEPKTAGDPGPSPVDGPWPRPPGREAARKEPDACASIIDLA